MNIKDLALLTWSLARIKLPRGSELSIMAATRSHLILEDCIKNQFLFDWTNPSEQDSLQMTLD